jgi:hypothetical protein
MDLLLGVHVFFDPEILLWHADVPLLMGCGCGIG